MQRVLVQLCLAAATAFFPSASAAPAVPVGNTAEVMDNSPTPYPYPGIRIWCTTYDHATAGCIMRLIHRYNRRMETVETLLLIDTILAAAIGQDLDPLLVASVIAAESSFNPRARSHCGAEGLMQLTGPVQPWLGVDDPFNIKQNIAGGCRYLTYLNRRFRRTELVLAAYNAGPGRVARLGRVPAIDETVRYIHRVTTLHAQLRDEVRKAGIDAGMQDRCDPFAFA